MSRVNLLIIDELGFVPLSPTGAELLFEVFRQRCERGSILVTANLPFDEWTEVFGSERLTGAAAGPAHPPRPHPGDERRQLPPPAQPTERRLPGHRTPPPRSRMIRTLLNQSNAIHPPLGFLHRTPCMPLIIIPVGHDYSAPVAHFISAVYIF